MDPVLAQRLLKQYWGVDLSEQEAATVLAGKDDVSIQLAAAQLHNLKEDSLLTDAEAYTAYAARRSSIPEYYWQGVPKEQYPLMLDRERSLSSNLSAADAFLRNG